MITTKVRAFATLRRFMPDVPPGGSTQVDLAEGTTLQEMIEQLQIPVAEVKVAMVNGHARPLDYTLQNADRVGIFPAVGGG